MTETLPARRCLLCRTPLPTTPNAHDGVYPVIECSCGLWYAPELIADADPDEWQRCLDRDGYTVKRTGPHEAEVTRHYSDAEQ